MKRLILIVLFISYLPTWTSAQDAGVEEAGYLPYWGQLGNIILKDSIAVVTSDYGLMTFDISDPTEPAMLDHLPIRELWDAAEISISGDMICLPDILVEKIRPPLVIDITNPANIESLPELPLRHSVRSGVIYGSYLYAVDGGNNLYVLDMTNPSEPEVIDTVEAQSKNLMIFNDLLVAGNFGYSNPDLRVLHQ